MKNMELTKTQLEAIADRSRFLAITAGAGSGKTAVLIERIALIIKHNLAYLKEVLAITFTEKAALELRERLCKVTEDELALASANIGTFHSFCSTIIREHAPTLGLDPDFGVIEEQTSRLLMKKAAREAVLKMFEVAEELEFKHAVSCIEELLSYRWHTHRLTSVKFQSEDREDKLRDAMLHCFGEAEKAYALAKGINLDFQDLEIFAIKLLEMSEIRARYQRRFKYILVDEFQDINDTQACIISLLHHKGTNSLTIVGDPKQSIYRFRGANVREFEKALKEAQKGIRLMENFRSRPGIVSFINNVFPTFEPLKATRDEAATPLVHTLTIESDASANIEERRQREASKIAGILPSLSGRTACLFSSLKSADVYTGVFTEHGIPFVTSGGDGLFERQDVIDILNLLRLVENHSDLIALVGVARSPYIGLSDEELYIICQNDKDSPLFDRIINHHKGGFLKRIEKVARHLSISELIKFIAGDKINDSIEKLCHLASLAEKTEKISFSDFIEYLTAMRESETGISGFPAMNDNAVQIMTIHQAKGLEFDNVIMCDTIRGRRQDNLKWCFVRGKDGGIAFKLTPENNPMADAVPTPYYESLSRIDREEEDAERTRLLYVAMSRAREHLIIPLHKDIKRDGDWHRLLTEKCKEMNIPEYSWGVIPAQTGIPLFSLDSCFRRNDSSPQERNVTPSIPFYITVSALEAYDRSPKEYHAKYILKTPAPSIPASIRGDIVHKLIERHARCPIQDVRQAINCIFLEMALPEAESPELEEITGQFRQYVSSPYGKVNGSLNEIPFMMKIENCFIKGKLDMLIKTAEEWEIVDFKTGAVHDPQGYDLQMKTYALATAYSTGIMSGRATLLFLSEDTARSHSINIGGKILDETEKKLRKIIHEIA